MQKHTPLPWTNNGGQIEGPGAYTSEAVVIATVGEVNNQSLLDTANARFIVQASNAHDDLLSALIAVERVADHEWDDEDESVNDPYIEAWQLARAAIAKATPEAQRLEELEYQVDRSTW